MLACPSCKTKVNTSKAMAELPPKIKCPGCGHIDAKESFGYETFSQPHQAYANQFAAEVPVRPPVQPSIVDKLMNIEYQSTKSYAAYLWIMLIICALCVDGLAGVFILITSGKSFIASMAVVIGVHLIALPVIRIVLEAFVNLERIAKR